MLFIRFLMIIALFPLFVSCSSNDKPKKDTSDLYAKSTQVDEIIKRSGTALSLGKNDKVDARALKDAENRLNTGGSIFGGKNVNSLFKKETQTSSTNVGIPINSVLWRSSLEVLDFMPLASVDAFSGTIITDWYIGSQNVNERCKLNVFIRGKELKTRNLKVNSFCQQLNNGEWANASTDPSKNRQIEDAILNKAKKIKLSLN